MISIIYKKEPPTQGFQTVVFSLWEHGLLHRKSEGFVWVNKMPFCQNETASCQNKMAFRQLRNAVLILVYKCLIPNLKPEDSLSFCLKRTK